MYKFSIGPITGVYMKPRYSSINTFVGEDFNPVNGLDIFLDFNTIINALGSASKFLNALPFASEDEVEEDIIASVLGVLKHWKDWSRKYEDTRIFIIMNSFEMKLLPEQDIIKSYLVPFVNKYDQERLAQMTYFWSEAMKKIEIVLNYIPKSYMIRCDSVDSYIIPSIIDDYSKNGRSRIIVSDVPMMTAYALENDVKFIFSRFKHQMNDPDMIVKSVSGISEDVMKTFIQNKVFYSILLAIIGDFSRGLIGISQMGVSIFANDLLRAVEKGDVPRDPRSIDSILPIINPSFHDYLRKAYMLINIDNHSMLINQSTKETIRSKLVDKYDIDSLSKMSIKDLNLLELL